MHGSGTSVPGSSDAGRRLGAAEPRTSATPAIDDTWHLLHRQIQATVRFIPLAQLANATSAVVLALFAIPHALGWVRPAWAASMIGVGAAAVVRWPPGRQPRTGPAIRWEVPLMALVVILQGGLNSVLAILAYPLADAGERVLLSATLAGAIGVGATALCTQRSVAFAWVGANVVGVTIAPLRVHSVTFDVLAFQLLLYSGALGLVIFHLSTAFERWCEAEQAADHDRQVIGVLLDDFESGARDWLWEAGDDGRLSHISDRLVTCSGQPRDRLRGLSLSGLLIESGALATPAGAAAVEQIEEAIERHEPFHDVAVPVLLQGEDRWWNLSGRPGTRHQSDRSGWRGVGSDITELRRHQDEILHLAETDTLTGLPNRRSLAMHLETAIEASPGAGIVAVGLLDLDNFKSVNDTLGHPVGDRLLAALAVRIRRALRPTELCARMGGDEFAVVITGLEDPVDAKARFAQIVDLVKVPFILGDAHLEIRASLGHASYPKDASSADELVMVADLALYSAKDLGRDRLRAFGPELREQALQRATALHELRRAIDRQQLELHYQPQIDLLSGQVTGFEALVRWNHPERGLMMPTEFITVAEENGLIVPLGEWVIAEACRAVREWPDDVRVSVNVSPTQLLSPSLVASFRQAIESAGISAARVEIEVTETSLIEDLAIETLSTLAMQGFAVALDDFGTGYSSLASLRNLPLDRVKVDRDFVVALDTHEGPSARAMLEGIMQIASALGLDTIAEGVETPMQREVLRSLGCHEMQGFVEAHAMPADRVLEYLAGRD